MYALWAGLSNASMVLFNKHRFRASSICAALSLELATVMEIPDNVFVGRLHALELCFTQGRYSEAQAVWDLLDPMGREWIRGSHRPGDAEHVFACYRFAMGDMTEDHLSVAQDLAVDGKNRVVIRSIHALRGKWRAERFEWGLAALSLREAVRMAREVRQVDSWSETLLVLCDHHCGGLHDGIGEASRLSGA